MAKFTPSPATLKVDDETLNLNEFGELQIKGGTPIKDFTFTSSYINSTDKILTKTGDVTGGANSFIIYGEFKILKNIDFLNVYLIAGSLSSSYRFNWRIKKNGVVIWTSALMQNTSPTQFNQIINESFMVDDVITIEFGTNTGLYNITVSEAGFLGKQGIKKTDEAFFEINP